MNVLSLFSGIGGLELGLERAGMTTVGQVEIDPYCRKVLARHWPEVPRHDDVRTAVEWWTATDVADPNSAGRQRTGLPGTTTDGGGEAGDFTNLRRVRGRPAVDLVCGGFPCQPVSVAGQRLAQADPRWLWPAFHGVVRALRPRYVLVENVPGLLAAGMGDVLGDLAGVGYDAEWDRIPAAFVGAPHLRGRIFIVAYPQRDGVRLQPVTQSGGGGQAVAVADGATGDVAHTASLRRDRLTDPPTGHHPNGTNPGRQETAGGSAERGEDVADADSEAWGTARSPGGQIFQPGTLQRPRRRSGLLGDTDGQRELQPSRSISQVGRRTSDTDWWAVEPDVGRVAHGVPARVDRLRALGNAVVPQVAEHVGRLILAADQERGAA